MLDAPDELGAWRRQAGTSVMWSLTGCECAIRCVCVCVCVVTFVVCGFDEDDGEGSSSRSTVQCRALYTALVGDCNTNDKTRMHPKSRGSYTYFRPCARRKSIINRMMFKGTLMHNSRGNKFIWLLYFQQQTSKVWSKLLICAVQASQNKTFSHSVPPPAHLLQPRLHFGTWVDTLATYIFLPK